MRSPGRPSRCSAIVSVICLLAFAGLASSAAAAGGAPGSKARGAHAKHRFRIGLSRHNRAFSRHRRAIRRHLAREASDPDVLFRGAHLRDFWLNQSAPGAIAEVPDPAGSGETVFKFSVGDSDMLNISPNPRGELLSPADIGAGSEFWFSGKFFLPAEFPSSVPGWMNVMQGPYGEPFDGPPPWHLEINGSHIQWTRNGSYRYDVPFQMPLVKESWVSVMVHERFASDGWIEMWVNGQPITFFGSDTYNPGHLAPTQRLEMQTMDSSNDASPSSVYLQSYRQRGMFPTLTTYEGPLTIGTTRASVGG
jgi:Polysaccharide lyase